MNKKGDIRIAVVGLRHGERHVPGFQALPGVVVTAICDANAGTLQRCSSEYGVSAAFVDVDDLLESATFDAAVVALPNDLHEPIGDQILRAGKHLLIDKPLAHTLEAGESLVASARAADLELCVLQDYRGEPCAQFLWSSIQKGDLGECYLVRSIWHRRNSLPQPPKYGTWYAQRERSGGGPLIDVGIHRIDLAMWCLGFPVVESVAGAVFGHHIRAVPGADIEDTAVGFVRFKNGAAMTVEASFMGHAKRLHDVVLDIRGSEGGARIVNVGNSYRQYEIEMYSARHDALVDISPQVPPPAQSLYAAFIEAIEGNRPPHLCSGDEALATLRLVNDIYTSAGVFASESDIRR